MRSIHAINILSYSFLCIQKGYSIKLLRIPSTVLSYCEILCCGLEKKHCSERSKNPFYDTTALLDVFTDYTRGIDGVVGTESDFCFLPHTAWLAQRAGENYAKDL